MTDTDDQDRLPARRSPGPAPRPPASAYAHEVLFNALQRQRRVHGHHRQDPHGTMILRDDAYDPARTIPLVDELIDSEKVFAIETSGSPSTLRTYDKLNQRCIPQPLPASGHPAFGDPVNHPWTTSSSHHLHHRGGPVGPVHREAPRRVRRQGQGGRAPDQQRLRRLLRRRRSRPTSPSSPNTRTTSSTSRDVRADGARRSPTR